MKNFKVKEVENDSSFALIIDAVISAANSTLEMKN